MARTSTRTAATNTAVDASGMPWGATVGSTHESGNVWQYLVPCAGPIPAHTSSREAVIQASRVDPDTNAVLLWSVGLPGIGWVMPPIDFPTAADAGRAV